MFIYKITNVINNNFYIGKTTRNLEKRFKEHLRLDHVNKMPINNAMLKYGKENFIIEKLDVATNKEELNNKEKYYIELLKPHYNCTKGGDGGNLFEGHKHTSESKEKIRLSRLGKKASIETKQKMKNSRIGFKQTKETISKKIEKQSKEYYFLNENDEIIKIVNLNQYCRDNQLHSSCMRNLLSGRLKTYKGYRRVHFEIN